MHVPRVGALLSPLSLSLSPSSSSPHGKERRTDEARLGRFVLQIDRSAVRFKERPAISPAGPLQPGLGPRGVVGLGGAGGPGLSTHRPRSIRAPPARSDDTPVDRLPHVVLLCARGGRANHTRTAVPGRTPPGRDRTQECSVGVGHAETEPPAPAAFGTCSSNTICLAFADELAHDQRTCWCRSSVARRGRGTKCRRSRRGG